MILDMLQGFKGFYGKYGDKVIVENYPMKQGLYIKVNDTGIEDTLSIYADAREIDFEKKEDKELFHWFRTMDYLSILPQYDTNKVVNSKSKQIHSNNFLTIFVKKKSLFQKNRVSEKFLKETILNYFYKIENFFEQEKLAKEKENKQATVKILELTPDVDMKLYEKSKITLLNVVKDIGNVEGFEELKDDSYIRIFFNTEIEKYEKEYRRYLIRKGYNKDKYHELVDGEVYGLPSQNMGTNPNKPSLELKTTKTVVPIRMKFEDVFLSQKLFDFLYFYNVPRRMKGSNEVTKVHSIFKTLYIPYNWNIEDKELTEYTRYTSPMYYVRTGMGTIFSIVDYDIIPPFQNEINFKIDNVLEKKKRNDITDLLENVIYDELKYISDLENYINYIFFKYKLTKSYFEDKIKADVGIVSKNMISIIQNSKNAFYAWFNKGNELSINRIINKVSMDIINEHMVNINKIEDYYRIIDMVNLRIALLKFFELGGNELHSSINEIKKELNNKLASKEPLELNSDQEFYFLAGQLGYYFTTKSESAVKMQNMSKPYLSAKNVSNIKDVLIRSYEKYSYSIRNNDFRFKNAYSLVMQYFSDGLLKDNKDIFLAGFLSPNMIFSKKANR